MDRQKDKKSIKEILKEAWNSYYYCLNLGLLFAGALIIFLAPGSISDNSKNQELYIMGSICIALWYISLPYFTMEWKTNKLIMLGMHTLFALFSTLGLLSSLLYFIENNYKFTSNILYTLLLVLSLSYLLYILKAFFKTCRFYSVKVVRIFFDEEEIKDKKVIKVIEGVTAIVGVLTSFGTAIIALIKIF